MFEEKAEDEGTGSLPRPLASLLYATSWPGLHLEEDRTYKHSNHGYPKLLQSRSG